MFVESFAKVEVLLNTQIYFKNLLNKISYLLENITVKREILTLVNNIISNEILVKKYGMHGRH